MPNLIYSIANSWQIVLDLIYDSQSGYYFCYCLNLPAIENYSNRQEPRRL